jgi:ABC-type uncharacterized transport system substrate-binding protein
VQLANVRLWHGADIGCALHMSAFDQRTLSGSMQRLAKELVALKPDLIVSGTTTTTAALLQYTRTISIVFVLVSDPVGSGFVASFSRPGGNVTGFNVSEQTMTEK